METDAVKRKGPIEQQAPIRKVEAKAPETKVGKAESIKTTTAAQQTAEKREKEKEVLQETHDSQVAVSNRLAVTAAAFAVVAVATSVVLPGLLFLVPAAGVLALGFGAVMNRLNAWSTKGEIDSLDKQAKEEASTA